MDLFFRKIVRDKGRALSRLLTDVADLAKGGGEGDALVRERELLAAAVDDVQGIVGTMVGSVTASADDERSIYKVGQNTTRLLFAIGDLVTSWLLLRQAEVALARLSDGTATGRDVAFYEGKVAAARFFARNVLPLLSAQRAVAEGIDNDLMDLDEAAF
jgi:hypothetical protein